MKKVVFLIAAATVIWVLAYFWNDLLPENNPPPSCESIQITRGSIELAVTGRGRTESRIEYVHSRERGRINRIFVKEGDLVKKKQPLVQIEPAPYFIFELKRAILRLRQGRLAKKRVQKELKRQQNLYKEGLATEQSVEIVERIIADTENEIKIHTQLLKNFESATGRKIIDSWDWENFEPFRINILAPFEGTILEISNFVGDPVFPSDQKEDNILTLGDLKEYYVRYYISEIDINDIQVGQTAELVFDIYPEKVFFASVHKVSNIAARPSEYDSGGIYNTSFFAVKLLLGEVDFPLRIGISSRIKIVIKQKKNILIAPIESILKEEKGSYALMSENNKLQKKFVKIGINNENFIEIEDGVQIGDKICKRPLLILEQWQSFEIEKKRTWVEKLIR